MSYFDPKQEGTEPQQRQGGAIPPGIVSYQSQAGEAVTVTAVSIDALRRTRPWVRFMSILMFVSVGLMVVGGLCSLIPMVFSHNNPMGWVMLMYIPLGLIYLLPGVLLHRYANGIATMLQTGDAVSLENALNAQRAFWKCVGIMAIVMMALYFVFLIVMVILGVTGAFSGHMGGPMMGR